MSALTDTNTTSTTNTAATLYDNAIQSIMTFLDSPLDFVSASTTSHRWYTSACNMKSSELASSRHLTIDCIENLTCSPLRHHITHLAHAIKFESPTPQVNLFSTLARLQLGSRMSHLKRLQLLITLDKEKSIFNSETEETLTRIEEEGGFSTLLPSQHIEHLSLEFLNDEEWSDREVDIQTGQPNSDPVRASFHVQMGRVTNILARSFVSTSPSKLCHLKCSAIGDDERGYEPISVPAGAIEPFRTIASLTCLQTSRPTHECINLLATMTQLREIRGLLIRRDLPRLVAAYGAANIVPPLHRIFIEFLEEETHPSLSRLTQLTDLRIHGSGEDIGESVLAYLPQLTRFEFRQRLGQDINPQSLCESLVRYAPQLGEISIIRDALTSEHLAMMLPRMKQLHTLFLNVERLASLTFFNEMRDSLLESVSLSCTLTSTQHFESLANLPRLRQFRFEGEIDTKAFAYPSLEERRGGAVRGGRGGRGGRERGGRGGGRGGSGRGRGSGRTQRGGRGGHGGGQTSTQEDGQEKTEQEKEDEADEEEEEEEEDEEEDEEEEEEKEDEEKEEKDEADESDHDSYEAMSSRWLNLVRMYSGNGMGRIVSETSKKGC